MSTQAQFKATGLFTRLDYVKPEERDIYKIFYETMFADLGPVTNLEKSEKIIRSIERASASAHALLNAPSTISSTNK